MSESFLGEIRMFAGNFAPLHWAYCDGQILPISQNDALFSLLSSTYGGDGRTTFAVPDMRGRVPLHQGVGPGLTGRSLGQKTGVERVSLTESEMPPHSHQMVASSTADNSVADPTNRITSASQIAYADSADSTLASESVAYTGSGTVHSNMMPSLAVHFIISLMGGYPPRN